MPERIAEDEFRAVYSQSTKHREMTDEEVRALGGGNPDRLVLVYRMYREGCTYAEIGRRCGFSRQRVEQIIRLNGMRVTSEQRSRARRQRKLEAAGLSATDVAESFKRLGVRSAVAEELRLPVNLVRTVLDDLREEGFRVEVYQRNGGERKLLSDEFLLSELRRAATLLGEPLSRFQYAGAAADFGLPGDATYQKRFGSFAKACVLAGVRANRPLGRRATSFTREDCIAALELCAEERGRIPSLGVYEAWWREVDGRAFKKAGDGLPGPLTIRNMFGGWMAAKRAAFG